MKERKGRVGTLVVALVALLLTSALIHAQSLTKVRDIRNNPKGYANEVVTLEGFATQWVEGKASTTSFYFLKDDWGGVIKVRTSKEQPEVGERYRVTGPVGIDPTNRNDVYVSEETRIHVRPEPVVAAPEPALQPVEVPAQTEEAGPEGVLADLGLGTWVLIAAIVVVLFLLVFLLMWLMRSQKQVAEDISTPMPGAGPGAPAMTGPASEPEPRVVEGRTIKMHAPPPGTLKILPGRFEVTAGDDMVKEIRFYRVRGQSTPELTFGRAAGPAYSHIQLKPMTVSSRQAKITYINNQWILTNFASESSNPTRYNGSELPVDGQTALKEGDRVEMGEVVLIYHDS